MPEDHACLPWYALDRNVAAALSLVFAGVAMAIETIPVVDLGPFLAGEPGALDRTAKELRFALTEIGFYFIVNHGVPRELIAATFEQVRRFHAQPLDRKLALKLNHHNTGYLPMRGNTLRTSTVQSGTKP